MRIIENRNVIVLPPISRRINRDCCLDCKRHRRNIIYKISHSYDDIYSSDNKLKMLRPLLELFYQKYGDENEYRIIWCRECWDKLKYRYFQGDLILMEKLRQNTIMKFDVHLSIKDFIVYHTIVRQHVKEQNEI